jgi:zinc transport system substrate-binding protein
VVTTLYPLEYFAGRIGGNSVEVANLMSAGVEAHDFEPTPADIRKIDSADLIVYNGSGFEPWIDRAMEAIGRDGRILVEASPGTSAQHDERGLDPHVWLDPLRAVKQVELIRDGLGQADPGGAEMYEESAGVLIEELEELHRRFLSGLSGCRSRRFVTSHAAFRYLAERYGLEQLSISGLSPGVGPSPGELAKLADTLRDLGIRYVMVESVSSSRLAETLAKEVDARLLSLHTLENLTVEQSRRGETYFSVMEANLRSLRTALECD